MAALGVKRRSNQSPARREKMLRVMCLPSMVNTYGGLLPAGTYLIQTEHMHNRAVLHVLVPEDCWPHETDLALIAIEDVGLTRTATIIPALEDERMIAAAWNGS